MVDFVDEPQLGDVLMVLVGAVYHRPRVALDILYAYSLLGVLADDLVNVPVPEHVVYHWSINCRWLNLYVKQKIYGHHTNQIKCF